MLPACGGCPDPVPGETSRRAYADEFFAAVHTQVGELRALLLCATSDQPRISPA